MAPASHEGQFGEDGHSTSTGENFGTQLAKHRRFEDAEFWQTNYLLKPGERIYPIPPFYFVENSSVLQHMVGIASSALKGLPPKDYNYFLTRLVSLSGFKAFLLHSSLGRCSIQCQIGAVPQNSKNHPFHRQAHVHIHNSMAMPQWSAASATTIL